MAPSVVESCGPPACDESFDILDDGQLVKTVLRQSRDLAQASVGARVQVHYVGRLGGPNGEIIDSSRDRNEPLTFTVGKGEVLPGLDLGIATMRQGELAAFVVQPELAYGPAGCSGGVPASPPTDAVNATLYFVVELLEVETDTGECHGIGDEEDDFSDLSPEERIEVAMRNKDLGNSHFKASSLEQALAVYCIALRALGLQVVAKEEVEKNAEDAKNEEDQIWSCGLLREERSKLGLSCHLNAAQCCLRLEQPQRAFQHALVAVNLDPSNAKALYRCGSAAMVLGLFDRARADLTEAARRDPRNTEIRSQLQACQKQAQSADMKERNTLEIGRAHV